jgi:hypothetical protein
MEPNNFEEDFRKKLNQRTIEPSNKAWDRLDAMLNVVEDKKPKKRKTWMYVAASIAGFLLVGTFFFTKDKSSIETPQNNVAVEQEIQKDSAIKPVQDSRNPSVSKPDESRVMVSEQGNSHTVKKEANKVHQETIQNIKKENNQIAESSVIIKNNQQNQSINPASANQNPKNETVDKLLLTAEKNVMAENSAKPKTKAKVKVSASDLLHQVDGELELSFREKVIATVNKNYQTVKGAVANRNQE